MLEDDGIFVEKCCSRCDRISWDTTVGNYNEVCTKKGRQGAILRCDIIGRRMETVNATGHGTIYDKDNKVIGTY